MKTMFDINPYGRYDMGRFSGPAFGVPVKMGCEMPGGYEDHEEELDETTLACRKCAKKHRRSSGRMGQAAAVDVLKGIWEGLLSGFGSIVQGVPPEIAGTYRDRLAACQAMISTSPTAGDYVRGTQCIRALYKDIQDGKGATPTLPAQVPASKPFPIVPVAIAGAGLIALAIFLVKMK